MVHSVCCLAGSAGLIDDIRAELRADGIATAIRRHNTATLFEWLVAALSYQGISNQVAAEYMEQHGSATWADINQKAGQGITCPKRWRANQRPPSAKIEMSCRLRPAYPGPGTTSHLVTSSSPRRRWNLGGGRPLSSLEMSTCSRCGIGTIRSCPSLCAIETQSR